MKLWFRVRDHQSARNQCAAGAARRHERVYGGERWQPTDHSCMFSFSSRNDCCVHCLVLQGHRPRVGGHLVRHILSQLRENVRGLSFLTRCGYSTAAS